MHRVRAEQRVLRLALAPPDDPLRTAAPQAVIDQFVAEAADIVSYGALLWLQSQDLATYTALLDAGRIYVAERATTGKKTVQFRTPQSGRDLDRRLAAPRFCQLYQLIVIHLRAVWALRPTPPERPSRIVSRRGRVGPRQQLGSARWQAQRALRVAAVEKILAEVGVPVTSRTATAWTRSRQPPSAVALQMLAHIIGKAPRTAKALLQRLRKFTGRQSTYKPAAFSTFAAFVPLFRKL